MVELLRHRGLEIENPQRVSHYIRNIGYYRLSAYMFPLLCQPKEEHCFKQRSKFQDALNLYRFDKKLRLFLFNEIEKVEIALRSTLANLVAEETGNIFWMTDETLFANSDKFRRTMELVDNQSMAQKAFFFSPIYSSQLLHLYSRKYPQSPTVWLLNRSWKRCPIRPYLW